MALTGTTLLVGGVLAAGLLLLTIYLNRRRRGLGWAVLAVLMIAVAVASIVQS